LLITASYDMVKQKSNRIAPVIANLVLQIRSSGKLVLYSLDMIVALGLPKGDVSKGLRKSLSGKSVLLWPLQKKVWKHETYITKL